ncbi:hypothetical protein TARUN_8839 [Trichoderma arundinaceum]|uniref:Apple domain-containing protein n=1 Tax=Trichoderma arundinaceum TaxID=490622 RepID=A0A395NBE4_TRIAR|nr:hypothetical protein TARUN_8839 [Trichoderma arundinaceum]
MVNVKSAFALLALGTNALARIPPAKNELICTTEYGRSSVRHVPTHTSTETKKCTYTELITKTPIVTVRAPPKTRTVYKTKTAVVRSTASTVTDVATVTSTNTIIEPSTNTVVVTSTYTDVSSTTVTPTYTMPTPDGFIPVSAEPGFVPRAKRAEYLDLQKKSKAQGEQCIGGSGGKPIFYPPLHVESVHCRKVVEQIVVKTVVKTARTVTKTLAPSTSTKVVSVTTTSTSTVFPADVTSTVTATTSTTSTSITDSSTTVVTTTSTTVTSQAPTVTIYLACSQENIASTANGGAFISNVGTSASKVVSGGNGGDALACCNACQATPFCQATLSSTQEGFCFLLTNKNTPQQCNPGQFYGDSFLTNPNPSFRFTVSNGPCGAIQNAGSVQT